MKLLNDIIKMKYADEGFLPDYPYHLISDEEMVEGFLSSKGNIDFFHTTYPLYYEELRAEYTAIEQAMSDELQLYLMSQKDGGEIHNIPYWVYSYMLGKVIGPFSDQHDRHDLFVLLGTDNIDDEFTLECMRECFKSSAKWIGKFVYKDIGAIVRPPAVFGEPHVIKYLRLRQADALIGDE